MISFKILNFYSFFNKFNKKVKILVAAFLFFWLVYIPINTNGFSKGLCSIQYYTRNPDVILDCFFFRDLSYFLSLSSVVVPD